MQRLEVEPGEPASVSGGVLAGQGKVVHAAEHLSIGGLAMLAWAESSGPSAAAGNRSRASWWVMSGATNALRGRRSEARTAGDEDQTVCRRG